MQDHGSALQGNRLFFDTNSHHSWSVFARPLMCPQSRTTKRKQTFDNWSNISCCIANITLKKKSNSHPFSDASVSLIPVCATKLCEIPSDCQWLHSSQTTNIRNPCAQFERIIPFMKFWLQWTDELLCKLLACLETLRKSVPLPNQATCSPCVHLTTRQACWDPLVLPANTPLFSSFCELDIAKFCESHPGSRNVRLTDQLPLQSLGQLFASHFHLGQHDLQNDANLTWRLQISKISVFVLTRLGGTARLGWSWPEHHCHVARWHPALRRHLTEKLQDCFHKTPLHEPDHLSEKAGMDPGFLDSGFLSPNFQKLAEFLAFPLRLCQMASFTRWYLEVSLIFTGHLRHEMTP